MQVADCLRHKGNLHFAAQHENRKARPLLLLCVRHVNLMMINAGNVPLLTAKGLLGIPSRMLLSVSPSDVSAATGITQGAAILCPAAKHTIASPQ